MEKLRGKNIEGYSECKERSYYQRGRDGMERWQRKEGVIRRVTNGRNV